MAQWGTPNHQASTMAHRNTVEPVIVGSEDRGARGMRESAVPLADDAVTFYAVSQVRLDGRQRVSEVVWGQVDTAENKWTTDELRAPVADVVAAIHNGDPVFALFSGAHGHAPQRRFVAVEHDSGEESIALEGEPRTSPTLAAMDRIVD
jgi:hypothetical protein